MPTPITACASASTSRSSSRVRARTRTRPRARIGTVAVYDVRPRPHAARASGARRRRTVAICTADVDVIAATSWPPNAGFHATSRSSSTSSSTASPVRPAPRRAATRDATSRPHAVDAGEDRPRCVARHEPDDRAGDVFFDVLAGEVHDLVGAPRRQRACRRAARSVTASDVAASSCCGRAEELAVSCARDRVRTTPSCATARRRDGGTVFAGCRSARRASARPVRCRMCDRASRTCSSSGASGHPCAPG